MVSPVLKIYILPVSPEFRPAHGFIAPAHNQDWGVEQDADQWLREHPEYITWNEAEADYFWFQPYWNRYYCNYWGAHTEELQEEILKRVSRNRPTFTVCEYDPHTLQPHLDLCGMTVFTASRNGEKGIDIPLLCSPHQEVELSAERRWLASFMGKFETSDYRGKMQEVLAHWNDVYLSTGINTRAYVDLMANSYIALAPRGHGGQSFRFYEAMQFECVPFLIGDLNTLPFPKWIDWSKCALYTDDVNKIESLLDSHSLGTLRKMGQEARRLWSDELHYGKWEKYLIQILEDRL